MKVSARIRAHTFDYWLTYIFEYFNPYVPTGFISFVIQ